MVSHEEFMIVFVLFAYVLELFFIDVAQECIESLAKPSRAVVGVVFVVQSQLLSLIKSVSFIQLQLP